MCTWKRIHEKNPYVTVRFPKKNLFDLISEGIISNNTSKIIYKSFKMSLVDRFYLKSVSNDS